MIALELKAVYAGPNPVSSEPVIVAAMTGAPEDAAMLDRAAGTLATHFAEWSLPAIEPGEPAALAAGQFVAGWALAALGHAGAGLRSAGARQAGEQTEIWLDYLVPQLSFDFLRLGARFLDQALNGNFAGAEADRLLETASGIVGQVCPDYIAREIQIAARALDIPVLRASFDQRFWHYGWGQRSLLFHETAPMDDSRIGSQLSVDKVKTKVMLGELGVPVPRSLLVKDEAELVAALEKIGFPCVIKPADGGGGRGVTAGIASREAAQAAWRSARAVTANPVMVEAHVAGSDYRLMVVRGKFFCAVKREPASVTGDGTSTVSELVAAENAARHAYRAVRPFRVAIPQDAMFLSELERQGLTPGSVVEAGREVRLRGNANRSTGGVCHDETELCHPDIRQLCEMVAASTGIAVLGLDYVTPDITRSFRETGGAIIEINTHPNIAAILAGGIERNRTVQAFLGPVPGRIPARLIVAPGNACAAMLDQAALAGNAGWVCADDTGVSAGIGGLTLAGPFGSLAQAARALLINRAVASLTLFATPEHLMRGGMPIDRVDRCEVRGASLATKWREVLRAHSGEMVETASL